MPDGDYAAFFPFQKIKLSICLHWPYCPIFISHIWLSLLIHLQRFERITVWRGMKCYILFGLLVFPGAGMENFNESDPKCHMPLSGMWKGKCFWLWIINGRCFHAHRHASSGECSRVSRATYRCSQPAVSSKQRMLTKVHQGPSVCHNHHIGVRCYTVGTETPKLPMLLCCHQKPSTRLLCSCQILFLNLSRPKRPFILYQREVRKAASRWSSRVSGPKYLPNTMGWQLCCQADRAGLHWKDQCPQCLRNLYVAKFSRR